MTTILSLTYIANRVKRVHYHARASEILGDAEATFV